MHIIFTGANYWAVPVLPGKIEGDFKIISGHRWIKSQGAFSKRWKMFPCPQHYQMLNEQQAKKQGLKMEFL